MSVCPRAIASSSSWSVTSSQRQTSTFPTSSFPRVFAARVARLEDGDLHEWRKLRLHLIPDPLRKVLARRVLETGEVVQVIVVEPIVERLPDGVDLTVVDEPTGRGVDRTRDRDLDLEGMTVQAPALVALGDLGQKVSRFEAKLVDEANLHERSRA